MRYKVVVLLFSLMQLATCRSYAAINCGLVSKEYKLVKCVDTRAQETCFFRVDKDSLSCYGWQL